MFVRAGAYREDFIQLAPLPRFKENVTNIAAWQYILNKSSANKEAAIRFLKYAASREGSIAYAEYMNRLPVRLDIIREEDLDIPGFEQLRGVCGKHRTEGKAFFQKYYGRYYFYGRFVPEICPGGNQPGRVLQRRAEHYRWFLKELYANIMFNI